MKTLASNLMILVVGLVIAPIFSAPVLPGTNSGSESAATVAPSVPDGGVLYVSSGATAHLCEEGREYLRDELDNCNEAYWACLSGEDPDGYFELDDDCDHVHRDCVEAARCEAEELCR